MNFSSIAEAAFVSPVIHSHSSPSRRSLRASDYKIILKYPEWFEHHPSVSVYDVAEFAPLMQELGLGPKSFLKITSKVNGINISHQRKYSESQTYNVNVGLCKEAGTLRSCGQPIAIVEEEEFSLGGLKLAKASPGQSAIINLILGLSFLRQGILD